jgi:signal peptidase I
MEPNIFPGEIIWIDKTSYGPSLPFVSKRLFTWSTPERGDVITFSHPKKDSLGVKRVIGIGGDSIRIEGDSVFVNGDRLSQTIVEDDGQVSIGVENLLGQTHTYKLDADQVFPYLKSTVTVPADKLFVMGDFRNNSKDSRHWGFVDADSVTGEVSAVALSFSAKRGLGPKVAIPVR